MSNVFTLQEVVEKQGLGPDARAFCEVLLKDGEVLAVALNYLPETVLWLVTTPLQARLMRDTPAQGGHLHPGRGGRPGDQPRATRDRPHSGRWRSTSRLRLRPTRPMSSRKTQTTTSSIPGTEERDAPYRAAAPSGALRLLTTRFTPSTDWLTRSASSFSAREVTGPVRITVPSCERTWTLWRGSARVE